MNSRPDVVLFARVNYQEAAPRTRKQNTYRPARNVLLLRHHLVPFFGTLLGHLRRTTTAVNAHLDDTALHDTVVQTAGVFARAVGYSAEPPPLVARRKRG